MVHQNVKKNMVRNETLPKIAGLLNDTKSRVASRIACKQLEMSISIGKPLCSVMSTISGVGDESAEASQRTLQMLSNIKRRKIQKALGVLLKGPGGGAMEGPPLIHRNHHSVHAGMEYFKSGLHHSMKPAKAHNRTV